MTTIQCPVCKRQFSVQMDISMRTKGLTLFSGKLSFLGKFDDMSALMGYIRDIFKGKPNKHTLVKKLVHELGIPERDAWHFVDHLLHGEGFANQR